MAFLDQASSSIEELPSHGGFVSAVEPAQDAVVAGVREDEDIGGILCSPGGCSGFVQQFKGFPQIRYAKTHAVIGLRIKVCRSGDGISDVLSGGRGKGLPQAGGSPAQNGRGETGPVAPANGRIGKRIGGLNAQCHHVGFDPAVCRWAPTAEQGMLPT